MFNTTFMYKADSEFEIPDKSIARDPRFALSIQCN